MYFCSRKKPKGFDKLTQETTDKSSNQQIVKSTNEIMKKVLIALTLLFTAVNFAAAQAEIKFDALSKNVGTFPESNPVQTVTYKFSNVGDQPLIINQAVASCGCTVPDYPKKPIKPGESGEIKVTYNGKGKFPGHFKKTITVRTNGKVEMTRLYIEGDMEEGK